MPVRGNFRLGKFHLGNRPKGTPNKQFPERTFPRATVPRMTFPRITFFKICLNLFYRWYTKVAETNEIQQKNIQNNTNNKLKYFRKTNLPVNETSTVNMSQILNFGFKFEN